MKPLDEKSALEQAQDRFAKKPQIEVLEPIEQHWEAISSLADSEQLFLASAVTFALATGSTIEETLELLDPDCLYVSDSLAELLETVSACPGWQQLILVQAIAAAVGLSMFPPDIEE